MSSLQNIIEALELRADVEHDVKFIRRIGEGNDTSTRPLLVGFYSQNLQTDVLYNARKLKDTEYSEVNIIPDLTKRQRQEDEEVRKFCNQKNESRTGEDLNFFWKPVGPKGQRRAVKVREETEQTSQRGGMNGARGRGRARGTRGRPRTSGTYQRRRLPSEKRGRDQMETEEGEISPPSKK